MSLTSEQVELRRQGIGSSESPGIAGIPSFTPPISTYRAKTEPGYEREVTLLMRMGHATESENLSVLKEREGVALRPGKTWKHPTLPIVDTCDAVYEYPNGEIGPVEAKLVLPWNAQEYGEEGTDEVPSYVFSQCQHHLWAMRQQGINATTCLVPVLIGLLEWRMYRVKWNEEVANNLIAHAVHFWNEHVLPGVPPPPDSTKAYTDYLAEKYPQMEKNVVVADVEDERAAEIYREARKQVEAAERRMNEAANILRQRVAEAEGVAGNGWKATWKADKNGKRTFRLKEERAA